MQKVSVEPSLSSQSVVRRHAAAFHAPVHDELVVTQGEKDSYFRLDATGKRIWELLESPTTVGELCDVLAREYNVERSTLNKEVMAFLAHLEQQELVEIEQSTVAKYPYQV